MKRGKFQIVVVGLLVVISMLLTSCAPAATAVPTTAAPAKATAAPAAATAVPATAALAKATTAPAAATAVPATAVPKATTAPTAAVVNQVIFGSNSEATTLDPNMAVGRYTENLTINLFDSLTYRGQDGKLAPSLAESWSMLDPLTWQFKLRKNVKFHNGEEFNADSVKFTIERIRNPDQKATSLNFIGDIKRVDIVDPYTVNVILNTPDVNIPLRLAEVYGKILPAKYVKEKGDAYVATHPVGTGPYKFVEWVKDNQMTLEANPDYWRGAPAVKKLIIKPILDDSSRIAALQSGDVDMIMGVPMARVEELKKATNFAIETVKITRYLYIVMDVNKKPFDNVKVRQALNYAIDFDSIIKTVTFGYGERIATVVAPNAQGYDASIKPYTYDPAKAKALLTEAGFPNGFETSFDAFTGSDPVHLNTAQAIVDQLAKVGVKAALKVADITVWRPKMLAGEGSPMFVYSYGDWALNANWDFTLMMQGSAGFYYKNQTASDLLKQANAESDPAKLQPIYTKLQQLFIDEAPYIFCFRIASAWGVSNKISYKPRGDEVPWFYTIAPAGK